MIYFLQTAAPLILFSSNVPAASFPETDCDVGSEFLKAFSFQATADSPAHGQV